MPKMLSASLFVRLEDPLGDVLFEPPHLHLGWSRRRRDGRKGLRTIPIARLDKN